MIPMQYPLLYYYLHSDIIDICTTASHMTIIWYNNSITAYLVVIIVQSTSTMFTTASCGSVLSRDIVPTADMSNFIIYFGTTALQPRPVNQMIIATCWYTFFIGLFWTAGFSDDISVHHSIAAGIFVRIIRPFTTTCCSTWNNKLNFKPLLY